MADLVTQTRAYWRNRNMTFRDDQHSGARGTSLWETAPVLAAMCDPNVGNLFRDDFHVYDPTASVGDWIVVEDAGASLPDAILDNANGVLRVGCDGDDEDEVYVSSLAEGWLFDADRPLWFEARVQMTEAGSDTANIIVGLSSVVAADTLQEAGAGPVATYDGAVFFKVDGGTVWQFESSNAGTQVTTTDAGSFTSAAWHRLGFTYNPSGGTTGVLTPYLDGTAGTAQNITISGLQEMHILFGVKTGAAATEEALLVDYVQVLQIRA